MAETSVRPRVEAESEVAFITGAGSGIGAALAPGPYVRFTSRSVGQLRIATGVPGAAMRASQRMPGLGMRMQPWEAALPSGSA